MIQWLVLAGIIGAIAFVALNPKILDDIGLGGAGAGGGLLDKIPSTDDDDDDDDKDDDDKKVGGKAKTVSLEGDMIDRIKSDALAKANARISQALGKAGLPGKAGISITNTASIKGSGSIVQRKVMRNGQVIEDYDSTKSNYVLYPSESWGIHLA